MVHKNRNRNENDDSQASAMHLAVRICTSGNDYTTVPRLCKVLSTNVYESL